jgi:hypothetical protein
MICQLRSFNKAGHFSVFTHGKIFRKADDEFAGIKKVNLFEIIKGVWHFKAGVFSSTSIRRSLKFLIQIIRLRLMLCG